MNSTPCSLIRTSKWLNGSLAEKNVSWRTALGQNTVTPGCMLPKELSCDYEPVRLAASSIFPQQAAGEPNWRLDGNSVVSRQSSCSRFPRIRLPFAGLPRLPERPNGSHRPVRCLQATHGNATHRRLWQRWIEPTGFKGLGFKGLGFSGQAL